MHMHGALADRLHAAARGGSAASALIRSCRHSHRAGAAPRQGWRRGLVVIYAREPPRMRSLRSGGSAGAQPQYGAANGAPPAPGSAVPSGGQPLYRGNLSGPSSNMASTAAVQPQDVLAANYAGDRAAAAAVATTSKPVVKFVPKRISLWDAMKFNGPAPEIIQGRLAMVGFVAGTYRETQTSETLLQQAMHLSPVTIFWLLLIVVASLQPITRAAKSEPFGWFTPQAEVTNARAAMLGIAVVAVLEWNAGVCFF